ncbi:hypothetical protein F4803DRAFT_559852 [Xylaria telfairii]|nr:hypothetical protein F4803DRAFT_559852 [Xylaria telfairii]
MALNNLETGAITDETSIPMNRDVWHLIFDQIDSRQDLCNVCLTSRAWSAMAITHLYRIIPLQPHEIIDWEVEDDPLVFVRPLISRLLDTKNEQLRNAVHELDFGLFRDEEDEDLGFMETQLVALVDSLPNLRRVKLRSTPRQKLFEDLTRHGKRISLHLLGEDGKRPVENDLPNVAVLAAQVNPTLDHDGPNRDVLGIQKLMFACPNLTSFSLKIVGGYGGCVRRPARFPRIRSFQFSGDEVFPPLEELSLSGYKRTEDEEWHWQERFQWSKLRSLTLGPLYTVDFLDVAAGYAESLRDLEVKVYDDAAGRLNCPPLKSFLKTFTSLESLTVRGYHLPVGTIGNHPDLKNLCLHAFEPVRGDSQRPTLSVEQLKELDKRCPRLETLELDLYRDGKWPEEFLKALATGFGNLRRLTLHLELGIRTVRGFIGPEKEKTVYIQPILNEDSAKDVGGQFFKWRSSSKLSVLVLKTGETLRRYPQWEPPYSSFERKHATEMEVYNPWNTEGVPKVVVLDNRSLPYH